MDVKRLEHLETANQLTDVERKELCEEIMSLWSQLAELKQEATGALFWIDKRTSEGQLAHAKLRGVLNRKYP